MRLIGYVRASTSDQQITLEAQAEKIRAMAIVKGFPISEIITDSGESAKDLDRPGMTRLLSMIAARDIDGVIIAKLDRITRSVKDLASLMEQFQKKAVSLISVEESLDTSSASGRLVLNIMVSVSQWEREAIGERTKTALKFIKSAGHPAGTAPYGFTAQLRPVINGKAQRMPLIPNPDEQAIIAIVREAHNSGHSYQEIADTLNVSGHRTRKGGMWQKMYIGRMLKK